MFVAVSDAIKLRVSVGKCCLFAGTVQCGTGWKEIVCYLYVSHVVPELSEISFTLM